MPLAPGTRLGAYEVFSQIGKGGMGEVYRARDTKLERDVAIKVLPDELALDDERVARFEREAKLLASLNHPNIAGIHGFEDSGGVKALVLELVEGPTLAERIEEGPIPIDEVVSLAKQIAEALEAGHETGVVHRDLKPTNVKLKEDGTAKVLDYGLAKALVDEVKEGQDVGSGSGLSLSPTLTRQGTQIGTILGSASYMSPEQARGLSVDKRSDIFSFGSVLFEMLTGIRAFDGELVSDALASVIRAEPDWGQLPSGLPPRLEELLRGCLEKDPRRRRRDIGDVRNELDKVMDVGASPTPVTTATGSAWGRLRWAVPAAMAGLLIGLAVSREPELAKPVLRFEMPLPEGMRFTSPGNRVLSISPDGSRIAFTGNGQVYVRSLDSLETVPVRGSQASIVDSGHAPTFSWDGDWVAFFAGGEFRKVALSGGAPTTLASGWDNSGISWGADGSIVYLARGGIWQVSSEGGEPRLLVPLDESSSTNRTEWYQLRPQWLPGGKAMLFTLDRGEGTEVVVQRIPGDERRALTRGTDALYLDSGHLLFALQDESTLFAVPFDAEALEIEGAPVPVLEGIARARDGAFQYDVSRSGSLVYVPTASERTDERLVWADRDGETPLNDRIGAYKLPRVSPDGLRVAVQVNERPRRSVWIWELERGSAQPLTTAGDSGRPIWSRDGTWVAFYWRPPGDGKPGIYRRRSDFSGEAELLLAANPIDLSLDDWSRDGRWIVYSQVSSVEDSLDLWALSLDGDEGPKLLVSTEFTEGTASLSPDGRYVAYSSDESGRFESYITSFPEPGGKLQVSTDGGMDVVWTPSGDSVVFVHPESSLLYEVDVTLAPQLSAGRPRVRLPSKVVADTLGREYDVHPDGKRFLLGGRSASLPAKMVLIVNWIEEMKRLVPTK